LRKEEVLLWKDVVFSFSVYLHALWKAEELEVFLDSRDSRLASVEQILDHILDLMKLGRISQPLIARSTAKSL
jgi:hypothetical protein